MKKPGLHTPLPLHCIIALAVVLSPGCTKKAANKEPSASAAEVKGAEVEEPDKKAEGKGPDKKKARSGRQGTRVVRSLFEEAPRAELYSNGQFINIGTPDQTKYILTGTGVASGWGKSKVEGKSSFALAMRGATVRLHDWEGGVKTLVIRARSTGPENELKVEWNNHTLETKPVKKEWDLLEIQLDEVTKPGRIKLVLFPGKVDGKEWAVDVDWIWLRRKGDFPPLPNKIRAMSLGEPRRSLRADPPRSYSYFLRVPEAGSFAFGYGATKETRFMVRIQKDGAEAETLFDEVSSGETWKDASVDLGAYAGEMVRLDLVSSSKYKEREVEGGWAEPDVLTVGKLPELARIPNDKLARNLIYIIVDAARQDAYRVFNKAAKYPTPTLTAMAKGGVSFTNAYTPANWTLPSVTAIMTGRYPHSFGNMGEMFKLPKKVPMLAEHLKEQGFETAALVANPFVSEPFGLKRGWDKFHNLYLDEKTSIMAESVYIHTLKWIDGRKDKKKRFFLYLHLMDPHDPYNRHPNTGQFYEGKYTGQLKNAKSVNTSIVNKKSDRYRKLNEDDKRWIRALYDGEVVFHDKFLKMFFQHLQGTGILEDTMVVYASDHGEELFDHGRLDHGHAMYEEQIKTPLILHYERLFRAGSEVSELVELLDLTPTLLEVLGVKPMTGTHGASIRHLIGNFRGRRWPYAIMSGNQLTVIAGQYKLFGSLDEGELYNLKKDPEERNNLIKTHHIAHRACEIYLAEGTSVPNKHRRLTSAGSENSIKAEKVVLDEKLRRQLEALGYME